MAREYRLFAAPVNPETIRKAADERFSRMTADYILIYRTRKPRALPCVEVRGSDLNRLTERDRAWLKDSILVILTEAAARSRDETRERMNVLMDNLEEALREEQEKLGKEDEDSEFDQ